MEKFRLALQPGEVSAENHRRGHGPALEMRDGTLHPAARACGTTAVEDVVRVAFVEVAPDHTHSGVTFGGIAFGD